MSEPRAGPPPTEGSEARVPVWPEGSAWSLLDEVGDVVLAHDAEGGIRYANAAARRLLDGAPSEPGARGAYALLGERYRELIRRLVAGAPPTGVETATIARTGRTFEVRVRLVGADPATGRVAEVWLVAREAAPAAIPSGPADAGIEDPPHPSRGIVAELDAIFDHAPDIVTRFDRQHRHTYVNRAVERIAGVPRERFLGRTNRELDMPDALVEAWDTAIAATFVTGRDQELEFSYGGPDGIRTFHGRLTPERGPTGTVDAVLGITRDVTESRVVQDRLRRHAEFRASLVAIVEASLDHGLDESFYGRLLEGAVREIPGAQAGSLLLRTEGGGFRFAAAVGFDLASLGGVEFSERELRRRADGLGPKIIHQFPDDHLGPERRAQLSHAGPTEDIEVTLSVPIVLDGQSLAYFNLDNFDDAAAFDDDAIEMARLFAGQVAALWRRLRLETDLRREREALEHLAFHDVVTGLPNRTLLHDRVEQAIERSVRTGRHSAVMLLDLDEFKLVNDVHGHDAGDELLREVAARLRTCVRDGDTVARLGGDEFVVLLTDLSRPEDAAVVAEAVRRRLREPVEIAGRRIQTSVSIGIDTFPGMARNREDLLKNADVALYRAKAQGKDAFMFWTHDMNVRLRERTALEADLRAALDAEDLEVRFQPRVKLSSGAITAFEALVRWRHEGRGVVPQLEFVRLAEETGLIRSLGRQVLRTACRQARDWLSAGTPHRVAVNLSARQLRHDDLVDTVAETLREHDLPARWLELELTESATMPEVDGGIRQLEELQRLGVYLSLDDFGTGHSSLDYLRRLPFHALKIDRSFVQELVVEDRAEIERASVQGASVVQAVVALGSSFHLAVVAEGVETPAQSRLLRLLGCDEAQGFFFGAPVPADEASLLAREGRIVRRD